MGKNAPKTRGDALTQLERVIWLLMQTDDYAVLMQDDEHGQAALSYVHTNEIVYVQVEAT